MINMVWSTSLHECGKISGFATFQSFEQTFSVLTKGSLINGVRFEHQWYTNWSWIVRENLDSAFFEAISSTLNPDCILQIIKQMDLLHLFYFAHINAQFETLAMTKLSRLRIFPSTVGSIGLMNFRYMLEKIGSSLKELSVSLNAFSLPFGIYFEHTKKYILEIIYTYAGKGLKTIYISDFNLSESEKKNFEYILQLFSQRGTEVQLN